MSHAASNGDAARSRQPAEVRYGAAGVTVYRNGFDLLHPDPSPPRLSASLVMLSSAHPRVVLFAWCKPLAFQPGLVHGPPLACQESIHEYRRGMIDPCLPGLCIKLEIFLSPIFSTFARFFMFVPDKEKNILVTFNYCGRSILIFNIQSQESYPSKYVVD